MPKQTKSKKKPAITANDSRFQHVIDAVCVAGKERRMNELFGKLLKVVDWDELDGLQIRGVLAALFAIDEDAKHHEDEFAYHSDREDLRNALADAARQVRWNDLRASFATWSEVGDALRERDPVLFDKMLAYLDKESDLKAQVVS